MPIPQVIGVVVSLAVVYYLLGLIVSFFTSRINEAAETRGAVLKEYIQQVVGKDKVGDFYQLPQLDSLKPIRYDGLVGAFLGRVKAKEMIESIPVANMTDAFFDFCKIGKDKTVYTPEKIKELMKGLPDSTGKAKVLAILDKGTADVDDLRNKISMWFGGIMDQAATHYKARARQVVILMSILVSFAFAADSIDLARQFWNDSSMLAVATAKAEAIVKEQPAAKLDTLVAELADLKIKFGWNQLINDFNQQPKENQLSWALWKLLGLALTSVAVSQGSSFWYDILRSWKGESGSPKEEPAPPAAQPAKN